MVDIDPFSYCLMLFTFNLLSILFYFYSLYQNSRIGEQESETLEMVPLQGLGFGSRYSFFISSNTNPQFFSTVSDLSFL